MDEEDIIYILALRQCKNIGIVNLKRLINHCGSAKNVWQSKPRDLLAISGIGRVTIKDIGNNDLRKKSEDEFIFCQKNHINIITQNDLSYPKNLLNCDDAPLVLFYKGIIESKQNYISIVGTRKMTSYGKTFIDSFLSEISNQQIVTVSGLALGTDTCVHEQSLNYKIPTIAVLAESLDKIYPSSNKKLSEKILENNGALISEYSRLDGISREYFLQRNRIIAGMSNNLIVTETAYGGGSITTTNYANQYNRDIYALPGKITDKNSQGCNLLISQNKAEAIVDIKSLINNLSFDEKATLFDTPDKIELPDNPQYNIILQILQDQPSLVLDEISEKSNIPHQMLLTILLELELYGYVQCLSGRKYCLK